ncbi:MAG: hypothetical protein AB8B51_15815 [Sedimentitalea sp.]
MLRLVFIIAALWMSASAATAGAWLRGEGSGFLSLGATARHDGAQWLREFAVYADYGLRPRLSVGLDLNDSPGAAGHALVFVRLPIIADDRPFKLATELAIGGHHQSNQWFGMLKASLAYGRGFESKWGAGWLAVETAVERRFGAADPIFKLDANIGLSQGSGPRPLFKIETAYIPGKPLLWAVSPALMFDTPNGNTWVVGLEHRNDGTPKYGISLNYWRRF